MAMDRFVKALKGNKQVEIPWSEDMIPGTDKVKTSCPPNLRIYSKESDLQTIIANEQRAFPKSKK